MCEQVIPVMMAAKFAIVGPLLLKHAKFSADITCYMPGSIGANKLTALPGNQQTVNQRSVVAKHACGYLTLLSTLTESRLEACMWKAAHLFCTCTSPSLRIVCFFLKHLSFLFLLLFPLFLLLPLFDVPLYLNLTSQAPRHVKLNQMIYDSLSQAVEPR